MATKYKLLVVDDNKDVGDVIKMLLMSVGFDVYYTSCPLQAIKEIRAGTKNIDAIITDYNMPRMNGLAMIKEVHSFTDMPYVLVSGELRYITDNYSTNEIARWDKPLNDFEDLASIISTSLENKSRNVC